MPAQPAARGRAGYQVGKQVKVTGKDGEASGRSPQARSAGLGCAAEASFERSRIVPAMTTCHRYRSSFGLKKLHPSRHRRRQPSFAFCAAPVALVPGYHCRFACVAATVAARCPTGGFRQPRLPVRPAVLRRRPSPVHCPRPGAMLERPAPVRSSTVRAGLGTQPPRPCLRHC